MTSNPDSCWPLCACASWADWFWFESHQHCITSLNRQNQTRQNHLPNRSGQNQFWVQCGQGVQTKTGSELIPKPRCGHSHQCYILAWSCSKFSDLLLWETNHPVKWKPMNICWGSSPPVHTTLVDTFQYSLVNAHQAFATLNTIIVLFPRLLHRLAASPRRFRWYNRLTLVQCIILIQC